MCCPFSRLKATMPALWSHPFHGTSSHAVAMTVVTAPTGMKNDFQEKLLGGFIQLRNELINCLVQLGLTNFKVLDVCCVTTGATTASVTERLVDLRTVTATDGIHFTETGYNNLASRTISCLNTIMTEKPRVARKSTFFWMGFRSSHGSSTTSIPQSVSASRGNVHTLRGGSLRGMRGAHSGRRPRSHMFHPYRRW